MLKDMQVLFFYLETSACSDFEWSVSSGREPSIGIALEQSTLGIPLRVPDKALMNLSLVGDKPSISEKY